MISVTADRRIECRLTRGGFFDALRLANGIKGRGLTARCGFFFLGIKQFQDFGFASVYFSLPECKKDDLIPRLRLLSENLKSTKIVVFPVWPDTLPPDLFAASHLYATDISDCFEVNWPGELCFASSRIEEASYSLVRDGKLWRIHFQGEQAVVAHRKGFNYLAHLLGNPGESFTPTELAHPSSELAPAEAIAAVDAKAIRQYRARLTDLAEDLEIAIAADDRSQVEALEEERDAILKHLKSTVGLADRPRLTGELERHRQAVSKAIDRALQVLPLACEHIAARLKRGYRFSYHPDRGEEWTVSTQLLVAT